MFSHIKWKCLSIICISFVALYLVSPLFITGDQYGGVARYLPSNKLNLGLDLRGGASLLLEADMEDYYKEYVYDVVNRLKSELKQKKMSYSGLRYNIKDENKSLSLFIRGEQSSIRKSVAKILEETTSSNEHKVTVNNCSSSGCRVEVSFLKDAMDKGFYNVIDRSIEVIRKRVDETGVRELSMQRQGNNRILLQVPGVSSTDDIKRLIGQTAKLSFHYAMPELGYNRSVKVPYGTKLLPLRDGESRIYDDERGLSKGRRRFVAVKSLPAMHGDMLLDARASMQDGKHVVSFKLTSAGARVFANITKSNVNKAIAIVLDNEVLSVPVVRVPILNGMGVITGDFTGKSANELAVLLRAGALPTKLNVIEERVIGATLGQQSIQYGTYAVIAAGIAVMIFMVLFYGVWGAFANYALFVNLMMILVVLSFMDATLTLPGIAGMALTLGMAVDANVLICEKMREESHTGLSVLTIIQKGYKSSLTTILDSNITTITAAVILYIFGQGSVRGFAVTLTIGILCSLFTAIFLTRMLGVVWYYICKPDKLGI